MGNGAQVVPIQGRSDGSHVHLVGIRGGRFEREIHEVEAVLADPVDLCDRITGRVVHCTDQHGVSSLQIAA